MQEKITEEPKQEDDAKDLGEVLVQKGLISEDQLMIAKKQMHLTGKSSLGDLLVAMGFVTESALGEAISKTSGIEKFDLKAVVLDSRLIRKIPKDVALRHKIIPVSISPRKILVAVHDVYDVIALDKVKKFFPSNLLLNQYIALNRIF